MVCAIPGPVAAQPRVRVIATGGTIANHPEGRLSAAALVASVAGLDQIARVDAETFASVPSLGLTAADWLRLARSVRRAVDDAATAGVVVTCGTDTMEELAWFLDLVVRTHRPVVVTGAMRRPGDPNADGPVNLADAIRVAADGSARGRGAMIVMQGEILAARDAMKMSTSRPQAFISTGDGPLGQLEGERVRFVRDVPTRHAESSEFDIAALQRLPRVDVLLTYEDAPGDLIHASVESGAKGLVIASAGAGSITAPQAAALQRVVRAGIPAVIATRVPSGRVQPDDLLKSAPLLIAAGSLTPVKARVLLMLGLAARMDAKNLARVFSEY